MLPVWLHYVGYALLVIGSGMVVNEAYSLIKSRSWPVPYSIRLHALEYLYVLGVGFKFAEIGPAWLRFHLADLGFPAVVGTHPALLYSA